MRRLALGMVAVGLALLGGCTTKTKAGECAAGRRLGGVRQARLSARGWQPQRDRRHGPGLRLRPLQSGPRCRPVRAVAARPDGKLTDLTRDFKGVDINGLDLSFDAKKVVFSMRTAGRQPLPRLRRQREWQRQGQAADLPRRRRRAARVPGGWPHRVRHQPALHRDGHARRRVQPRPRASRSWPRSREISGDADRIGCARRTSRTTPARSPCRTAWWASRAGSTSARSTT